MRAVMSSSVSGLRTPGSLSSRGPTVAREQHNRLATAIDAALSLTEVWSGGRWRNRGKGPHRVGTDEWTGENGARAAPALLPTAGTADGTPACVMSFVYIRHMAQGAGERRPAARPSVRIYIRTSDNQSTRFYTHTSTRLPTHSYMARLNNPDH